MAKTDARILILDIETFPNIAYVWGKYDQNVIRYTQEKCIATFAAKWLGKPMIMAKSLPDYPGYKPGSYDDSYLVRTLHTLFGMADIIVAHNGDQFDVKYCQSRFIFHKLPPPRPFKTVDTKKVARKVANFNSNKADDLGSLLSLGRKIKTDFDLWEGCIKGDMKQWKKMLRYNVRDVLLLERLYKRLLPWTKNHPPVGVGLSCPKCGSTDINFRGFCRTTTRKYRQFQCMNCGGWGRDVKSEPVSSTTNIV